MRTKLFLLLIFSSLTSLSYSQKLTQEDFQGLWYRIDDFYANYDSIYNLKFEKNIFVHSFRDSIEKITANLPAEKKKSIGDSSVGERLLEDITILSEGFADSDEYKMKFTDFFEEPLEVFEVQGNNVKFYCNIFYSDIVYSGYDRDNLKQFYGENFIRNTGLKTYSTSFKLGEKNIIFFKKYNSSDWTQNEILYYRNDTIILRNSSQNFYSLFVRKTEIKNANFKLSNVFLHQSHCWGTCPEFSISISAAGKVFLNYENSWGKSNKTIVDGNYILKISEYKFKKIFELLKYLNLNNSKNEYFSHPHKPSSFLKFFLSNGKKIEFKNFIDNGPVEIRLIAELLFFETIKAVELSKLPVN